MTDATPDKTQKKRIKFVDIARHNSIYKEELEEVLDGVLESGKFIGGSEVDAFEKEFANYVGVKHAIATASGTDALRISLEGLGIGPGDKVATVSFTFVSTVDSIIHVGAKPVFVDIDPSTYTMSPDSLRKVMNGDIKAILPVHLYGHPADMDQIMEIASEFDVPIVEDAAQAHGASYYNKKCGSIGRVSCFSFYPSKNLGALGDGGIICTNDDEVETKTRLLHEYGQTEKYKHVLVGYNSRLDALQAAVLRKKLKHLDEWNKSRSTIAAHYSGNVNDDHVVVPTIAKGCFHAFHIYAVKSNKRDLLRDFLRENGVETGIHYPIPVHLQQSYSHINVDRRSLLQTESTANEVLSLPMFPELQLDEVDYIVDLINHWGHFR